MNLELRIVTDSRSSQHRTHGLAALLGLWSRSFACKADACSLLAGGRYVSCPPLLRTACDCIAAQTALAGGGLDEFAAWLQAVAQSREQAALDVGLGRYRAGSMLATDQRLGAVYRAVSDLSMPHFGVTLLQVALESDPQRVSIAFADSGFHLGWAELIVGWLLVLVRAQLETAMAADAIFAVSASSGQARPLPHGGTGRRPLSGPQLSPPSGGSAPPHPAVRGPWHKACEKPMRDQETEGATGGRKPL
jgi:hypothetical protein